VSTDLGLLVRTLMRPFLALLALLAAAVAPAQASKCSVCEWLVEKLVEKVGSSETCAPLG
jgi:hypothetical protein